MAAPGGAAAAALLDAEDRAVSQDVAAAVRVVAAPVVVEMVASMDARFSIQMAVWMAVRRFLTGFVAWTLDGH